MDDAHCRKQRKEEGKRLKRKKIEESGGIRPRFAPTQKDAKIQSSSHGKSTTTTPSAPRSENHHSRNNENGRKNKKRKEQASHRFGKVMESVPCLNKPRRSTVSVAVPGSVVANCQTREQKTQLAGQMARAATIYHIDEIIVYDDKLSPKRRVSKTNPIADGDNSSTKHNHHNDGNDEDNDEGERQRFSEPNAFLARVLQFCECPQYLRRAFFPMHPDLQFAGMLAPIDAPHHVRADDHCPYREGVVLDKKTPNGSLVNCGIRGRPVV